MAIDWPRYPIQWPVRPVDENPNLRIQEYRPPAVPAVAPPRVVTAEQVAAMVRADEVSDEYDRLRRLAHARAFVTATMGVHIAAVNQTPRTKPSIWRRIAWWLGK